MLSTSGSIILIMFQTVIKIWVPHFKITVPFSSANVKNVWVNPGLFCVILYNNFK